MTATPESRIRKVYYPCRRGLDGAPGVDHGHVALVFFVGVGIRVRIDAVRGPRGCRRHDVRRQCLPRQGGFRCRGSVRRAGHAAQDQPRPGAGAGLVHRQCRRGAYHHIAGCRVRQLGVARPGRGGRQRDAYGCQDLVGFQGGGEEIHEEVVRRHRVLARGRGQHERRAKGREGHRQVRGRVGMGDAAAHGAPVPHLQVADHRGRVGQPGQQSAHGFRRGHLGMGRERADDQVLAVHPDTAQAGDVSEVDQDLGLGEPELHGRNEAVPPGQQLAVLAVFLQQAERFLEGGRRLVSEASWMHAVPSSARRPNGWP